MHLRPLHRSAKSYLPVAALFTFTAAMLAAGQDGRELVEHAAAAHRANKSAIRTWRGTAEIEDRRSEDGRPVRREQATIDFAYDATRDLLRWNWRWNETVQVKDGMESDATKITAEGGIKTKTEFWQAKWRPGSDGGRRVTTTVHPPESAKFGPKTATFHPMYFFDHQGMDLSERFLGLRESLDPESPRHWTAEADGTKVSLKFDYPPFVNQYVVDLAQGGALVRYRANDGVIGSEDWTMSCVERAGIWVPQEFRFEIHTLKQKRTFTREIHWAENQINEPLPDDAFDLAALGLQDGDRVGDARSGSAFTVGDERARTPVPAPADAVSRRRTSKWILVAGNILAALVAVALVTAMIWRRRNAARQ